MKLLLDAHILLWVLYEPERLADRTRNAITDESNELFVSLATLWEIVNKAATHRLPLAGSSLGRIVERIEELGVAFGWALPLVANCTSCWRPMEGPREAVKRRANARSTRSGYLRQNMPVEFLYRFLGIMLSV